MFSEKRQYLTGQLINNEYKNAIKRHGEVFNSPEEAYVALMGEIEETKSELFMLEKAFENWKETGIKDRVQNVLCFSTKMIQETSQIAAVCLKILNPDPIPED